MWEQAETLLIFSPWYALPSGKISIFFKLGPAYMANLKVHFSTIFAKFCTLNFTSTCCLRATSWNFTSLFKSLRATPLQNFSQSQVGSSDQWTLKGLFGEFLKLFGDFLFANSNLKFCLTLVLVCHRLKLGWQIKRFMPYTDVKFQRGSPRCITFVFSCPVCFFLFFA